MEAAIFQISELAPTGLLTLITIAGVFCAKFLWSMDKNVSAIRAYALELHNLHEKKIEIIEFKQVQVEKAVDVHALKIENHGNRLITLEERCYATKKK